MTRMDIEPNIDEIKDGKFELIPELKNWQTIMELAYWRPRLSRPPGEPPSWRRTGITGVSPVTTRLG